MPDSLPPSIPGSPQPPTPRRRLGPLAWLAIGCGGIVLLGIIASVLALVVFGGKVKDFAFEAERNPAKATAELAVKLHPDLELIHSNEESAQITFRKKSTGEEVTTSYQNVMDGNLQPAAGEPSADGHELSAMTFDEANIASDAKPAEWVKNLLAEVDSARVERVQSGPQSGTITIIGQTSLADLTTSMERTLSEHGFAVEKNFVEVNGQSMATLTGKRGGQNDQEINISFVEHVDGTLATIEYRGAE